MIPISDNVATRSQPLINYFLITLNLVLFVWELKLEVTGELKNIIYTWGLVSAKISSVISDVWTQGNPAGLVALLLVSSPLLVGMFFHSSFAQILGNLIFLFVFGKSVENILGHGRFLVFYLLCGVLTSVVQVLADPTLKIPLIGANGVVAAVIGAYIINFHKAKIDTILPLVIVFVPIELPAVFFLFWWFVQQLLYGFGSLNIPGGVNSAGITYWAQGAGLVFGAIFAQLMKRGKPSVDRTPVL